MSGTGGAQPDMDFFRKVRLLDPQQHASHNTSASSNYRTWTTPICRRQCLKNGEHGDPVTLKFNTAGGGL
jgi:hypothetical protein